MKFLPSLRPRLRSKSFILHTSRHPDPRLQASWNCAQLGLFIFPLIPSLGGVGLGLALLMLWKQQYRTITRRPLNWGLAILIVWLIISSAFAFNRSEAFLGLANFLPFFLFFVAFSILIQTPAQLRQLAWILVIPSVPVVILGFGQLFWGWAGLVQLQPILGWVLEAKGSPPGRMSSAFMYANTLAAYLQIVFILGLGLWVEEAKKRLPLSLASQVDEAKGKKGNVSFFPFRFTWRMGFLSFVVIGNAIALILTDSRNAWAITVLSCLAFALYLGWRWLLAVVAAVATSVLWAAFGPSPVQQWLRAIVPAFFWARLTDQMYPDRPLAMLRVTQWHFAWFMTQQRPWTGWGLRNFTPLYEAQMHLWLGHPHNLFLMLSAETGIPATLLFCGLVGWVLAQGVLFVANCSSALPQDKLIFFSYLVAFGGCTIFNTVDVSLFDLRVNTLGWLLLSAIWGVVYKQRAIAIPRTYSN